MVTEENSVVSPSGGSQAYVRFLSGHTKWQSLRYRAMKRAGFSCQQCGKKDGHLSVHHLFYEGNRKPWEYNLDDLSVLCPECHWQAHMDVWEEMYQYGIPDWLDSATKPIGNEPANRIVRGRPQHAAYQLVNLATDLLRTFPQWFANDSGDGFGALKVSARCLLDVIETYERNGQLHSRRDVP